MWHQALPTHRLTGTEPFTAGGLLQPFTVHDFWAWSSSNLLDNITRGRLAEFLVAAALGLHHDVRGIWESYDLVTPDGLRIEVKTAAYVQTWAQERPSDIRFGIAPREGWDPVTGQFDLSVKRRADVYVFCLLS